MARIDILVPDIGDFDEVTVIELLVQPGDTVKPEQSLITVESDKASMEIPCSHAGVVKELKVKMGDKVLAGQPLYRLYAQFEADLAFASELAKRDAGYLIGSPSGVDLAPGLAGLAA